MHKILFVTNNLSFSKQNSTNKIFKYSITFIFPQNVWAAEYEAHVRNHDVYFYDLMLKTRRESYR